MTSRLTKSFSARALFVLAPALALLAGADALAQDAPAAGAGEEAPPVTVIQVPTAPAAPATGAQTPYGPLPPPGFDPNAHLGTSSRAVTDINKGRSEFDLGQRHERPVVVARQRDRLVRRRGQLRPRAPHRPARRHALGHLGALLQQPLPVAARLGVQPADPEPALDLPGRPRAPARGRAGPRTGPHRAARPRAAGARRRPSSCATRAGSTIARTTPGASSSAAPTTRCC